MKYRSCWPSRHDLQVNVTRLTDVWPSVCLSCFYSRKVEKNKHFYRCPRFWSKPHPGVKTLRSMSWNESRLSRVPMVQPWMLSDKRLLKHELEKTWIYYESESISNQPIPFPMDREGHDFHALFQYMFYTWVQNCTPIESFFNKILNVKHG